MGRQARRTGLLFLFVLTLFLGFQLAVYRQYAFESAWLYAKKATGRLDESDLKRWGSICNSLHRMKCSVRIFRALVQKSPGDMEALSNLAVVLAMIGEPADSEPYFKAYLASGGGGLDVMFWYGRALVKLDREVEALPWLYNVLAKDPQNREAAEVLLSLLLRMNRSIEAQSLLASLIELAADDSEKKYWRFRLAQIGIGGRSPASEGGATRRPHAVTVEAKIPALNGRHFYIPVALPNQGLSFIQTSEDEHDSVLAEDDLPMFGALIHRATPSMAVIRELYFGPIKLSNIEMKICQDCVSRISSRYLAKYNVHVDGRGQIPYLVLNQEE